MTRDLGGNSQTMQHSTTTSPPQPSRNGLTAYASQLGRSRPNDKLKSPFSEADLKEFRAICSQQVDPSRYPLSSQVLNNVLVYSGPSIRSAIQRDTPTQTNVEREAFMEEMHHCLLNGPGVFLVKGCVPDMSVLQRATQALKGAIEGEKAAGTTKGDHFAAAGSNDRLWNSFQKHALQDPENFVQYYANEIFDLVCGSWLGPGYQITAQTNVVKPGGKAQMPHRDYHLGFQSESVASKFPIVSQISSQLLTLQGAVAHTDMPLCSGPTKLLPFSQRFLYGYTAYRHPEFVQVFDELMVQVELEAGDAVFFNPALFHAAGDNITADFDRIANLLQVSACWSRPMESVDHNLIVTSVWDSLLDYAKGGVDPFRSPGLLAVLRAICDGYSFPTNLDKMPPPKDGHCPASQYDHVMEAMYKQMSREEVVEMLSNYATSRTAS